MVRLFGNPIKSEFMLISAVVKFCLFQSETQILVVSSGTIGTLLQPFAIQVRFLESFQNCHYFFK